MIPGRATPEGTAAFRRRCTNAAPGHFRTFGGLAVSSIGLGTYLGDADDATDARYEEAVRSALRAGINVLDTAINYRGMRSERAVGRALAAAIGAGEIRREEVVIATKGGLVPFDGSFPANPRAWLEETYHASGIVGPRDLVAGCHCMTPRYLADQLERSRTNLGAETVDVYHLHNPETQLAEVDRNEFMRRLTKAFEFLERACADGKVGVYGTATWTAYRRPPEAADYVPLTAVAGIARQVGGPNHRFRAIQLPYNLAMPEAFALSNQPVARGRVSALAAAEEHGLYVMTSASILHGRLARDLPADLGGLIPGLGSDAERALQFVRSSPGVGTALVGMSRAAHVETNARLVGVPPLAAGALRALFTAEAA